MPWRRKNLPLPRTRQNRWKNCLPRPGRLRRDGYPGGRWTPFSQDAPEPSGAKRVRQGKTAPDEQDLIPEPEPEELSLPEQRRQTARQFFGAMFLTLILLGGVFGALLVEESYRRVGMGSLPTQVFSARLTEEGIAFTVGEAAPDPEQTARLAWLADRLEPFLLPRGLRITVRALLGGRLLLDWL